MTGRKRNAIIFNIFKEWKYLYKEVLYCGEERREYLFFWLAGVFFVKRKYFVRCILWCECQKYELLICASTNAIYTFDTYRRYQRGLKRWKKKDIFSVIRHRWIRKHLDIISRHWSIWRFRRREKLCFIRLWESVQMWSNATVWPENIHLCSKYCFPGPQSWINLLENCSDLEGQRHWSYFQLRLNTEESTQI